MLKQVSCVRRMFGNYYAGQAVPLPIPRALHVLKASPVNGRRLLRRAARPEAHSCRSCLCLLNSGLVVVRPCFVPVAAVVAVSPPSCQFVFTRVRSFACTPPP